MTGIVAIIPPVPALLAGYAGLEDPIADLRSACRQAVSCITRSRPEEVAVLADAADRGNVARGVPESIGIRVARSLLVEAGFDGRLVGISDAGERAPTTPLVVVANGSARRGEKAPGHLDVRAFDFDREIEAALTIGNAGALRHLDADLGAELLAAGIGSLIGLGSSVGGAVEVDMLYAGDPFGVRYWVVTWTVEPFGSPAGEPQS